MVYFIKGKAQDFYNAFANGNSGSITEDLSAAFDNDLTRANFLGSKEERAAFFGTWVHAKSQYIDKNCKYTQDTITGSGLGSLLATQNSMALQKAGESMSDCIKQVEKCSFAFMNGNQACAISFIYRKDDPTQWAIQVTKGTNEPDDKKEIFLLSGADLGSVVNPIDGVTVAIANGVNDLAKDINELKQSISNEAAQQILEIIIPADGKFNKNNNIIQYCTPFLENREAFSDEAEKAQSFKLKVEAFLKNNLFAKLVSYGVVLTPQQADSCIFNQEVIDAIERAYPPIASNETAVAVFPSGQDFFDFYEACGQIGPKQMEFRIDVCKIMKNPKDVIALFDRLKTPTNLQDAHLYQIVNYLFQKNSPTLLEGTFNLTLDLIKNGTQDCKYDDKTPEQQQFIERILLLNRLQALVGKGFTQEQCNALRAILFDDNSPQHAKLLTAARTIEHACGDIENNLKAKPSLAAESTLASTIPTAMQAYKASYYDLVHQSLTEEPLAKEDVKQKIAAFEQPILLMADQSSHPWLRKAFSALVNAVTVIFTLGQANQQHKEETGRYGFFSVTPSHEKVDDFKLKVSAALSA